MLKVHREESLQAARNAAWKLGEYIISAMDENDPLRIGIQCLLDEFERLDAKEQKQIKAGQKYGKLGAVHGSKGGRPKKNIT